MITSDILLAFMDNLPHGFYRESLMLILALILIEGLLSVDNAMAIAAMASHLPRDQQKKALRWGIIGAYLFRGIVLFMVSALMNNMWVKWIGSAYLVYLAANHLSIRHKENNNNEAGGHSLRRSAGKGLIATIVGIELMDLSLSIDNVVAAVALVNKAKYIPYEYHIWVVCIGVFIGILALRIVAGWCIDIMRKYPILSHTAFLLVGFVGIQLMAEMTFEYMHETGMIAHAWNGGIAFKFAIIIFIVALSILYSKRPRLHAFLQKPVHIFRTLCMYIAEFVHIIMWPITAPFNYFIGKINHNHD